MKVLRNAVNNEFSGAMDDVVHVLSEMRERLIELIEKYGWKEDEKDEGS